MGGGSLRKGIRRRALLTGGGMRCEMLHALCSVSESEHSEHGQHQMNCIVAADAIAQVLSAQASRSVLCFQRLHMHA